MSNDYAVCSRPACTRQRHYADGLCRAHGSALSFRGKYVPIEKVVDLLDRLNAAGVSDHEAARQAGIHHLVVSKLRKPGRKGCQLATYQKLAQVGESQEWEPVWPIMRRLRALATLGFSTQGIADACASDRTTLNLIMQGKTTKVQKRRAVAIREFYEEHQTDPLSAPTRAAVAGGWKTPFEWVDIDDPDEGELQHPPADGERIPLTPEIRGEVEMLVQRFGSMRRTAQVLGLSKTVVERISSLSRDSVSVEDQQRVRRVFLTPGQPIARRKEEVLDERKNYFFGSEKLKDHARHQLIDESDMAMIQKVLLHLTEEEKAGLSRWPPRELLHKRGLQVGMRSTTKRSPGSGSASYIAPKVAAFLRGDYTMKSKKIERSL